MTHVLTIGHILVDVRVLVDDFATTDRESKIINISNGLGGSAANVACGIVKLGGKASVIGKIGMDSFGRLAVDELIKYKVDISGVRVSMTDPTGFTIVLVNQNGNVIMYGFKGAAEKLSPDEILSSFFKDVNFVHIASLRMDSSVKAAKIAKENKAFVSFDPGRVLSRQGSDYLKKIFRYIDVLLVNHEEAELLTGLKDFKRAAKKLHEEGVKNVIVKLGSKGVYSLTEREEIFVEAYKVKAIDTTGAGDSFASGLITMLGEGANMYDSIKFANAVAAIKVQRLGAQQIPTRDEVEDFITKNRK